MKGLVESLRVRGDRVQLANFDPRATPGVRDKEAGAQRLAKNLQRIDDHQYGLYAEARRSLLIVLQGMDTSGKDGVVRHVMTAFNPQGCRVYSFKAPTPDERAHDFLWRIHKCTPGAGSVAVFNRSHYEDVLVVRVHGLAPRKVWSARYDAINEFERLLHVEGTRVLKFFLHISREEQRERLLARLDEPEKHWKFNENDVSERVRWRDYHRAYEVVLERCNTAQAPWFIIPADRKWYRDVAISEVVADALEEMNPKPPKVELDVERWRKMLRS